MKKTKLFFLVLAMILCAVCLNSCGTQGVLSSGDLNPSIDGPTDAISKIYARATDLGYDGTLEEFLTLVKGADGQDGRGIDKVVIENGTLILYMTDDTMIDLGPVCGTDGVNGTDGQNGQDGKDGLTPYIKDGYWWIGDTNTNVKAEGTDGKDGVNGADGQNGQDGKDGLTPYIRDGYWWIGDTNTNVKAEGTDGKDGVNGTDGKDGKDGKDGQDGVGILDMEVNELGELIVTLTDGTVKNLGKTGSSSDIDITSAGVGVTDVRITEEKTFRVTLSNGIILESAPLDVDFGGAINGVSINADGELIIHTAFGVSTNYGKIEKIYISAENEIMVDFASGDSLSFGYLSGSLSGTCVHEYGEWSVGLAPTCTSIGYNKSICSICGDERNEFVPMLGHKYGDFCVIKEPNGYENGVQISACDVCGNAKIEYISGYSEGLTFEKTDKEEYRVTGLGSCTDTEIFVPNQYEGLPVTEIGEKAFYHCSTIVAVTLPDTIVKVHDKAFSECENLSAISMSDSVQLGTDVFRGSIHIEIIIRHKLTFVEYKKPTCTEPGNIAHWWCEICNMFYEDEKQEVRLFDVIIPSSHTFVDGVCINCGKIQDEILIVEIENVGHLGDFPLGTLENAIGLPDNLNVRTADGVVHQLPVIWNLSDYNKAVSGDYTIQGILQSGDYYYDDGLSNVVTATITITERLVGTADIVFILDISGSMSDEITNVKNNINKLAQAMYDRGVSARFAAVTYSDYIDCPGDYREMTKTVMNGSNDWFTDVNAYKTAISNINIANGGDAPELAVDGLMYAYNNLETRKDSRVFYVLLTDANYKVSNSFGVKSMQEAANILETQSINTSVITSSDLYDEYNALTSTTGGINANINGNFAQTLYDSLIPIIYEDVIS